jgi:hypothetical protein
MSTAGYEYAWEKNGIESNKALIYFQVVETIYGTGLRCNAVGGVFGYGFSFPVRRHLNGFVENISNKDVGKSYMDVLIQNGKPSRITKYDLDIHIENCKKKGIR